MDNMIYEIIGYVASVVTAFSLTMKNIRRLRWWNMFGAAAFSAYGAMIGAWPVFALNGFVAIVDAYYLITLNKQKEYFDLIEVDIHNSDYVKRYLDFHQKDIATYFPDFKIDPLKKYRAVFCLRNTNPVNLIVASELDKKDVLIELDYVIPEYRDMKNGQYFYHEGIKRLGLDKGQVFVSMNNNTAHQHYLKVLGFKFTGEMNGLQVFKK
jgi:hypothetical protein